MLDSADEKNQLIHRCSAPFIRHVLAEFRFGRLAAAAAAAELELSPSRFYELYSDYLAAGVMRDQVWNPGVSGGDHAAQWPAGVEALLRARLSSRPASSYSFIASEVLRLCDFKLDRAQVRRWAMQNQLARPARAQKPLASVRRWQRSRIGELWQLDASPHQYFPSSRKLWPMLNMIDDCSRLFTGSKLYQQEILLAYFDLLPQAFRAYGLPLMLYVDYHSLFFSSTPDALTTLGEALKFYDVTFRYAPTPQAKGKIEREHQFWQNRLPPYFAAEQIKTLEAANPHIDALRQHHNAKELHREIKMPPQQAWDLALKQKRSVLRPVPNLSLVAIRLEPPRFGSRQPPRTHPPRNPNAPRRRQARFSRRPLPTSFRPPIYNCPAPQTQHQTHRAVHQPSQMIQEPHSGFANYTVRF